MIARDAARGEELRARILQTSPGIEVEVVLGDLSLMSSVRAAAVTISSRHPKLGGLIHCAAVFAKERRVTSEGFESMFATNHLGPFL